MSELKVYHHELRHNEYEEFYLKYEADKVIAELKADYQEACDRLQTANLIKDEQLSETRHSKRKLCLAKSQEWRNYAAFCGMQSSCHNHRGFGKTAEKYSWKEYHAWKCVHRYKELAEKFKETK
jgi:hypothetical protein